MGLAMNDRNPPASVFQNAAGDIGLRLFGIVMWAAAITSVVGAAFTSVSFLKTFHPSIERQQPRCYRIHDRIGGSVSLLGNPVRLLVFAGTVNGFILPIGLSLILIASRKRSLMKDYVHPLILQVLGWMVVAIMLAFSVTTIASYFR